MKVVEQPVMLETEPERASGQESTELGGNFIVGKKRAYGSGGTSSATGTQVALDQSWEPAVSRVDRPVRIISYMGSLPNDYGYDGDFYVDEMTNMIYGPKAGGVWPEEGVSASGLCKRTWIALTRARVGAPPRENGFRRCIRLMLLPVRFFKGLFSFRAEGGTAI